MGIQGSGLGTGDVFQTVKTHNSCYSCFKRQAEELCARARLDEKDVQNVMNSLERLIKVFSSSRMPVEMAVQIHDLVKAVSGNPDPYHDIKQHMNQTCKAMLPEIMNLWRIYAEKL